MKNSAELEFEYQEFIAKFTKSAKEFNNDCQDYLQKTNKDLKRSLKTW